MTTPILVPRAQGVPLAAPPAVARAPQDVRPVPAPVSARTAAAFTMAPDELGISPNALFSGAPPLRLGLPFQGSPPASGTAGLESGLGKIGSPHVFVNGLPATTLEQPSTGGGPAPGHVSVPASEVFVTLKPERAPQ